MEEIIALINNTHVSDANREKLFQLRTLATEILNSEPVPVVPEYPAAEWDTTGG